MKASARLTLALAVGLAPAAFVSPGALAVPVGATTPASASPAGGTAQASPAPAGEEARASLLRAGAPEAHATRAWALPSRPSGTSRCPVEEEDFRAVTALLARWADRARRLDDVPGLVLGLACGPDRTWTRGFGLADRERAIPATDTTLFRIASITKVFTALAVLQLRDDGLLALDDAVAEHLPWFRLENTSESQPVTLRHLLTHTSGLPTNSAATDFNRMTSPTVAEVRRALPTQHLAFTPGTAFKYSNLGFSVLGQVIESASGRSYRRYMEERVLAPLGLEHTVVHPSPDRSQARGYHLREPDRPRRPADFLHLASFTPAGGMATTAEDLVRFVSHLIAPERSSGALAPETLREMQRVHHWVDSAHGGSGLAWGVERRPGVHEIYHGGGLPTQTSHIRLDVPAGVGVVVLTNAEDADPARYATEALALLRMASEAGGAVENAQRTGGLDRYVGRYRFLDREMWVVRLAGRLGLVDPKGESPSASTMWLRPLSEHRFRIEGDWAKGETAEFVVEEGSGDAVQLRLPAFVLRRVGAVVTLRRPVP